MLRRCPISSQYIKLPVEDGGAPGSVDSFNGRTGIVVSQNGDYTASQITNVPHGSVSATNVQAAINELADESASSTLTNTHIYVGNVSNVATDVALSGDATLANTGALTLASTAVTPGSYGSASAVPGYTVDAKGRLTAAADTSIQIAESQVTNLVSDLAAKQSTTLTSAHILVGNVSNVAADVAMSGDVAISNTGATTIQVGAVTDAKSSLAVKPPVTVVATSNLTLSGAQTIDGQLTVAGISVVLATAQSAGAENGPWVVRSGAWTRPVWYPSGGTTQAIQFSSTLVRLGTTYRGTTWRQGTAAPITIDTDATTWAVVPFTLGTTTVSGTLPVANGGTGTSTYTNGQLLIGNTSGSTLAAATLTAGSGIAITNGASSITISGSGAVTERTLATAGTLATTDNVILLDSTSGAFNLTLPAASTVANRVFQLKDISGVINTNNVTLVRNGSNPIEGLVANKILTTNFGGYRLYSTGTAWWLL